MSSTLLRARAIRSAPAADRRRTGLVLLGLPGVGVLLVALVGPLVAPQPAGRTVIPPFAPPSWKHPLGGDYLGHDAWSELLQGGRSLIVLPLVATFAGTLLGGLFGVLTGYYGGLATAVLGRALDFLLLFPGILVILLLAGGWGAGPVTLVTAVLVTMTPYTTRYVRSAVQRIRHAGFVEQAEAIGERTASIMVREVLPNIAGPVLSESILRFVGSIYLIASANYLGFGPKPPNANWAVAVQQNLPTVGINAWPTLAPALLIIVLTASISLTGDRLAARWAR